SGAVRADPAEAAQPAHRRHARVAANGRRQGNAPAPEARHARTVGADSFPHGPERRHQRRGGGRSRPAADGGVGGVGGWGDEVWGKATKRRTEEAWPRVAGGPGRRWNAIVIRAPQLCLPPTAHYF